MQQFIVPQFIDVEDKVIGPITVRQFIIMLIGGGFVFVAYKLSDLALFLVLFFVILFITILFAFVKVNGRPVHYLFLNFAEMAKRPKIRVWKKEFADKDLKRMSKNNEVELPPVIRTRNKVKASRLAELSLVVDTGGVYQGEDLELPEEDKLPKLQVS